MRKLFGIALWLGLWVGSAHADSGLRCDSRLVGAGDSLYEVREKCGEPDAATQRSERRTVRHITWFRHGDVVESVIQEREVEVTIDEWTYDFGPNRFVRFLTFENGRLHQVRTGGYGKST